MTQEQCGCKIVYPDKNYEFSEIVYCPLHAAAPALLEACEIKMDEENGKRGDETMLCIFCHAKRHNSKVGVIHYPKICPVHEAREAIKKAKP